MRTTIIIFLLSLNTCFGQTLIYRDNMEDTGWTWKGVPSLLLNSKYTGGISRSVDAPPNTALYTSFDSAFVVLGKDSGNSSVETDTLTFPTVSLNPFGYYRIQYRVCSFGIDTTIRNTAAGVDVGDYIQLEYKINGGLYVKELKVTGFSNLRWSYGSNSIIKIASGINTTINFNRGIGTVGVDLPLGISQFSCRLTMVLNGVGESWFVDDVDLILIKTTALPIELIEFNGKYYNTGIRLYWSTASEINNDHFEILKSSDGTNFTKIKTIIGRGNSSNITNYEYVDYDVCDKIVYYKLRQVDYDGTTKEYDTIAFKCRHPYIYEDFYDALGRKVRQDYDGIKIYRE